MLYLSVDDELPMEDILVIQQRKKSIKFIAVLAMLVLVLPVLGAIFSFDGGNTEVLSYQTVACNLEIIIKTTDSATYRVDIFDDGVLKQSQTFVRTLPGTFVVSYNSQLPAAPGAPGVAVNVYKNGAIVALDSAVLYTTQSCTQALADAQNACSQTAVIPVGSVVGDLPLGGRAYWAPGKITPEVYINPGTYWVVDAFRDEDGNDWYQIYLSCQYLWVPAEWMSPTFDGPWDGQALPLPSNLPDDVLAEVNAAIAASGQ